MDIETDTYRFRGKYRLIDPRTNKQFPKKNFRGEFILGSDGEILGEFYIGNDREVYDLVGRLEPNGNNMLLNILAEKDKPLNPKELPRELQFFKKGSNLFGQYGGGIRIASTEVIARLNEEKYPFLKDPEIWIRHRSDRNSTLKLVYCN